jgi:HEPN domain-containing protein
VAKESKVCTEVDGYTSGNLLHFAFDHLAAANTLFENSPRFFDSAGYLIHLGLELLLKAWHFHVSKEFSPIHDLETLYNDLEKKEPNLSLPAEQINTIKYLNNFYNIRYQSSKVIIKIGCDDTDRINILLDNLYSAMPKNLKTEYEKLSSSNEKGNRILMKRPK